MPAEALIIVRGGDQDLRVFCSGMLAAGLATCADFHSAFTMLARDGDVETTNGDRVVMLRLPAANVASCMEQLRAEVEDASAVAIPVLASF